MDSQFTVPVGQVEARSAPFVDLDVTKNGRHFDGYAAIYGEETDLGANLEVILPPAFRSGLAATDNLPMLWDHNGSMPPFATTRAGTLKVEEDRRGLRVQAEIDERHILGPTMMSMAERGELHGMSFGFITGPRDNKISERGGRMLRAITGFKKLLDVSPTWNPAYAGTSAELRSLQTLQSASMPLPEQTLVGGPQQPGGGPVDGEAMDAAPETSDATPASPCAECGKAPCECQGEPEEQRAGAAADRESEAAARRRRLHMMGLSLPRVTL